ncbi:putative ATP synthase [Leptomonas seymouri]|uniref:V-type proton ATPase subunit H n=1 Tax=Leptomonas seymouri TaxID=5684 RepID=A0A0N1IIH3_LEPSE|nr:putative ATP synthase [Leptomonas seymouri]|eukprot:KPI84100.1 putative ATP synthase [Leptomonas seymouri]
MPTLSADAADTISLVLQLQLLDENAVRLLEQLFTNRLDEELVNSLVGGREESLTIAMFRVCAGTHTERILGYALRFLADLVYADQAIGVQLGRNDLQNKFGGSPASLLLQIAATHSETLGISNPAIYLAAIALRFGTYEGNEDAFKEFFALARHTFSPDTLQVSDVEFTVRACVQLARRKDYRPLFFKGNILSCIPRLLTDIVSSDSAGIIQIIYETLLLSWLLSFEYEGIVLLVRERMIPQLHRVLQRVQKEKCVRVTLMTLLNMVEAERKYMNQMLNPLSDEWVDESIQVLSRLHQGNTVEQISTFKKGPSLVAEMVSVGMIKTLSQLFRRKFGDEDINVMVENLNLALESSMQVLTSFSQYRGEVLSGVLEWTPVHTSAKFWKENAEKVEGNNYEVLIALGKTLCESKNEVTLAVACHDLGEIIRYHPTGRNLLTLATMSGVKERVMSLMSHTNPEVAKEALLCTQKVMVQRWEYMQTA